MSMTWEGGTPPPRHRLGLSGWLRISWRVTLVGGIVFGGLALKLVLRGIEKPVFSPARPITGRLTTVVCRSALRLMGLSLVRQGTPMQGQGAIVANHASWLDIFSLNASDQVFFVSKAEVAKWPGIGLLARATGTLFIARDPKQAREHTKLFEKRLTDGHRLLFFPEGTSTDGHRVLPFKTTLFAALLTPDLKPALHVQPVSLVYHAPDGADPRFYGWWGDMDFGAHLLATFATRRHGKVEVVYHPPLRVSEFDDRKALAKACEEAVRRGVLDRLPTAGETGK